MDKLIRRTRMVERQAARRLARVRDLNRRNRKTELREERKHLSGEVGYQLGAAIKARHEDWELGPLAPRRDVPVLDNPHVVQWGSISSRRATPHQPLPPAQLNARCAWAGGAKYLCLKKKDRVAVIDGWLKGKIGVVGDIHKDQGTLLLGDIAKTNVTLPEYTLPEELKDAKIQTFETPIPISAVRLVYPLKDEETGVVRDVVIKQLKPINIHHDRPTEEVTWDRFVPGLNVEIPWPTKVEEEAVDGPHDTLRIDVEERTFVPTLLRPPIPETVVDELRNQYSKFRTRHTPEYIAKKEAEEAEKKARVDSVKSMLTPLQEFNRHRRELRRARGQPELTDEMLEKIGQIMAKNQGQAPRAASGTSEIESGVDSISLETPSEPPAETRPPAS